MPIRLDRFELDEFEKWWRELYEARRFVPLNQQTPHYLVISPKMAEIARQILAEPTRALSPDPPRTNQPKTKEWGDFDDWDDPSFDTGINDGENPFIDDPNEAQPDDD